MKSDLMDVSVLYQHRTLRAVCVRQTLDGDDIWFPLSQVEVYPAEPLMRGEAVTLTAPLRLLTEKGLA
ncbi:MAG: hypothetical protein VYD87_04405 [Pseudomonadota bacterium]|nr:hypothetical protein [Pseudomonadota bacterium]MEE3098599.1 hypothetical protein [Pseudomonadota bacterium]